MSAYYLTFDTPTGPRDVEISDWARWVAQDEDGLWGEFYARPRPWKFLGEWGGHINNNYCPLVRGTPPADWTQEIYEVVR